MKKITNIQIFNYKLLTKGDQKLELWCFVRSLRAIWNVKQRYLPYKNLLQVLHTLWI